MEEGISFMCVWQPELPEPQFCRMVIATLYKEYFYEDICPTTMYPTLLEPPFLLFLWLRTLVLNTVYNHTPPHCAFRNLLTLNPLEYAHGLLQYMDSHCGSTVPT